MTSINATLDKGEGSDEEELDREDDYEGEEEDSQIEEEDQEADEE